MEECIMGLSRRQFSREFKLAALQRLERGASVGEVARAFEINPNLLHRLEKEAPKRVPKPSHKRFGSIGLPQPNPIPADAESGRRVTLKPLGSLAVVVTRGGPAAYLR